MKFKPSEKIELDLRGDFTSLDDLNKLRVKLARRANSRLLRLEKKASKDSKGNKYIGWAYKPTTRYTQKAYGSNRFSTRKEISDDPFEVIEEVEEIINFLNAKSSTPTGIRSIENQIIQTFRTKHHLTIKNPKEFLDFLASETFKDSKKNLSSEQVQDFYDRTINDTKKGIQEIEKALENFNLGKIKDITELYKETGLDFWKYQKED
jgi:hypothetical protein